MLLRFLLTTNQDCSPKMLDWLETRWEGFPLPDEITFDICIIIYAVDIGVRKLHSIEPSFRKKYNAWLWGIFLDEKKILESKDDKELSEYILEETKKRIRELKTYKTLRCIKDRSVLDILDNSLDELFKEWI